MVIMVTLPSGQVAVVKVKPVEVKGKTKSIPMLLRVGDKAAMGRVIVDVEADEDYLSPALSQGVGFAELGDQGKLLEALAEIAYVALGRGEEVVS